MKKILFLTSESPFPPLGGAHIRDAYLIDIFRETMEVEVLCFETEKDEMDHAAEAQIPEGVTVTRVPAYSTPLWKKAVGRLQPSIQNGFSPRMADALRERASTARGSLLWISRLGMAHYLELGKSLGFKTILDQHQVETQNHWSSAVSAMTHPLSWPKGARAFVEATQCGWYEGKMCGEADAVVAASDLDASRLLKLSPGAPVHIIPHAIDVARYAPARTQFGRTLLYTGTLNYEANIEGLDWFVAEVLPRLRAQFKTDLPEIVVAGSHPSAEFQTRLEAAGIRVIANPPSLLPLFADSALVFVPLLRGRSMRFKILEAMAAGRPVVTTPRGADGLVLSPGYDIWFAESPDKFAGALSKLFLDESLRAEVGEHAAQTVAARYDWGVARQSVTALMERLKS